MAGYSELDESLIDDDKPVLAIEFGIATSQSLRALAAMGSQKSLGGSPTEGVTANDWVRVVGPIGVRLNDSRTDGLSRQAVVYTRTTDAGTSVQWRIVDEDDVVIVTGSSHTSTSWTEEIDTFALTADGKRYFLEVKGGNLTNPVLAYGSIEEFDE